MTKAMVMNNVKKAGKGVAEAIKTTILCIIIGASLGAAAIAFVIAGIIYTL